MNKQLMINENLILNCTAVGNPRPRIQWLVNGTSKPGMENIFSTINNSTHITSFLNISMSAVTHTGTYSCLATNSFYSNHSLVSNSATVTVYCKLTTWLGLCYCVCIEVQTSCLLLVLGVSAPDISITPTVTATVGLPLILECNVSTLSDITNSVEIIWSSDGVELTRGVNITSTTSNTTLYTSYYTIPQLSTTDHNRVYQCSIIINESPLQFIRTTVVNVNG